jgi:hypothetical protein
LLERAFDRVFPSKKVNVVYTMFSRSLKVMSKTFRHDMYELRALKFPIEIVELLVSDPLAITQYSCLYWVNHLLDCDRRHTIIDLKDGGSVYQFLKTSYIFWLKAHSLMKSLLDGIVIIMKLENMIKVSHIVIVRMLLEKPLLI